MSEAIWRQVDDYIEAKLLSDDDVLAAVLKANAEAGLPAIDVSPAQGKFLTLLARLISARQVLEIGTLGGYSTICLARGVSAQGHVTTLEYDPKHAAVARANFMRAGVDSRITVHEGAALDSLNTLNLAAGSFDLVFIDADKPNNPNYLEWARKLTRRGGVIVCDNVVRKGRILDSASREPAITGTRALYDALAAATDLSATVIQTVGSKGWDGFVLAVVD